MAYSNAQTSSGGNWTGWRSWPEAGAWVSDPGFGFNPAGRSAVCATGRHRDCGHVRSATRPLASPHRLRSTITLCRCVCHGTCLLAEHEPVSLTTWQELCECPGAAEQRAWKDPDDLWPGFTERWEQAQREHQERREAKKQAEHAVRDAAYGKTRDELRDLYIAEFRARGLDLPPEVFLEAEIDKMTGHPLRGLWRLWRHTSSDT